MPSVVLWIPNPCCLICWRTEEQWQIGMPLNWDNFVFMFKCLNNWDLLKVHCITNMYLWVIASTCNKVAINRVRDPTHLLLVELLVSEALLHVEVPNGDGTVAMTDSCKAVEWISEDVLRRRAHARHHVVSISIQCLLLLVRKCNIVHLWVAARFYLTDGFLAANVEK